MGFNRDLKAAFFKALIKQTKSVSVPIQNLKLIFDTIAKYIDSPARGVLTKNSIHKKAEAINGFPHIRWYRAQKNFHVFGCINMLKFPVKKEDL